MSGGGSPPPGALAIGVGLGLGEAEGLPGRVGPDLPGGAPGAGRDGTPGGGGGAFRLAARVARGDGGLERERQGVSKEREENTEIVNVIV